LSGVEPRDDRFYRGGGCELRGPAGPGRVVDDLGDLQVRGGGDVGAELLGDGFELELPGGVHEQQPEPVRVGARCLDEPVDTGVGESAHRLGHMIAEDGAEPVEHCLVQVGLGVEVPVEDDAGDARLGGDVVEASRREAVAGERRGGRREDLLPALSARQAPDRLLLTLTH
jgi:hypothetical protein